MSLHNRLCLLFQHFEDIKRPLHSSNDSLWTDAFVSIFGYFVTCHFLKMPFKWAFLWEVVVCSCLFLCTPLGQGNRYQHDSSRNLITKVQELTSSKELWFRAAVIAVPIAGGLILVLLIMLALRMLRSENKRLQDQRQQMLSRLHYSFHGHHSKKGQVAKLDLECMVPVSGQENCCLTCDKMRQAELSNEKILSLVHWGMYSGHGKLEFVWHSRIWTLHWTLEGLLSSAGQEHFYLETS